MLTLGEESKLRTSAHLAVVPRPSDYAIYHHIYGRMCLIDQKTLELLQYFQVARTPQEALTVHGDLKANQISSFIDFFQSRGFLVASDVDEGDILTERRRNRATDLATGRQIRIVQLVLANRCNFRCKYCFEGLGATPLSETIYANSTPQRLQVQGSPSNSFMNKEQAQSYLEQVIQMAKGAGNTALAVQFFGGEPLVNWKTIRHILDHFGRGERHGIDISYSIITNGSLITEEVARTFREFDVPIVVSYDSPEGDARPLPSGKNSHEVIRRGLELLRSYGNRVVLNSVLADATFDIFNRGLIDFAFTHGIYEIGVVLDLDARFYENRPASQIVDKLWDVCVYGWTKGVVVTGYWHQIFQGIAADDRYNQVGFQNCSAMGVQFSIEPGGDVFSCKASGGHFGNVLKIGELLQSETYKTYAMRACTSPAPCQKCALQHFCGGMCLGPIENKYKHDIYAVEEAACDVYREVTRRFILSAGDEEVATFYLARRRKARAVKETTAADGKWSMALGSLVGSSTFTR
ncbi:MAG TPA: radical SAM protein [Blastocatellia bacterium]|jgi:uncharacterized protein